MIIKTEELRTFFKRCAHVRSNAILPVYNFIKIERVGEGAVLTRASEGVFVRHAILIEGAIKTPILIDFKFLKDAVDKAETKEIEILVKDKRVKITDGITPAYCQLPEAQFPVFPETPEEKVITFSFDVLDAIGVARKHCQLKTPPYKGASDFVHIKKVKSRQAYVWGMNVGSVVYFKTFHKALPDLQLDLDACEILGVQDEATFYKVNNWMIFECGATVYGFGESDSVAMAAEIIMVEKAAEKQKHFSADKTAFILFCERAIGLNRSSLPPEIRMQFNSNKAVLSFSNSAQGEDLSRSVDIDSELASPPDFVFNANQMLQLLRSVPQQALTFHRLQNCFFITTPEDEDYIGLINGLAYAPPPPKAEPVSDELPFKED